MVKEVKIYLILLLIITLTVVTTAFNIKQLDDKYNKRLSNLEVKYEQLSNKNSSNKSKKTRCLEEKSAVIMGKEKWIICDF